MSKVLSKLRSDDTPLNFIYLTICLAAVLPEYLAPVMTLACFVVFKKHFSLTAQKVKMGTVGKVFLLFMCYSLISAFWSSTPVFSAAISLLWMGMLLGSFFVSNMITDKAKLQNCISLISIGGGIVGGIGFLQYLLLSAGLKVPNPLWSVLDKVIYNIMPFDITYTAKVWEDSRAASTFDNPLICATYLIIVLPVAVYGFIGGDRRNRYICGINALLIIGGVLGTTSRGAALGVIAALAVLVFMNSKKAVGVIATLVVSAGGFLLVIFKRNQLLAVDLESSTDSRLKMWEACLKLIGERPVFGYGAGCETTAEGLARFGVNKPHAHSLYFEMATELGIVGILFLGVVFAFILYDIIKLIRCGGEYQKLGIAFLAMLVGFAVASATEFTLQTPKELQFFMIILGMLEASKRLAANEAEKKIAKEKETAEEKIPAEV